MEWLEYAILEYISKNQNVDSVDIVSHFGLRSDITLLALRRLIDSGKVIENQPYLRNQYNIAIQ